MAHKTMVDGTNYEIKGGRTLVNGTAYSIDKGKALIGGTAYEVGFGPSIVTKTVTIYPTSYEKGECDLPELSGADYCTAVSDNDSKTDIYSYDPYDSDIIYTLPCPSVCSRVTSASINAIAYLGEAETDYYANDGGVSCTITGIIAADGSVVELSDEHSCNDGDNSMALSDTILAEINSRGGVSAFMIMVVMWPAEWDSDEDGGETYLDRSGLSELSMTITGDFYEE